MQAFVHRVHHDTARHLYMANDIVGDAGCCTDDQESAETDKKAQHSGYEDCSSGSGRHVISQQCALAICSTQTCARARCSETAPDRYHKQMPHDLLLTLASKLCMTYNGAILLPLLAYSG